MPFRRHAGRDTVQNYEPSDRLTLRRTVSHRSHSALQMSFQALSSEVVKDEQAKICVIVHKWCGGNAVTHYHASDGKCRISGDRKDAWLVVYADRFSLNTVRATSHLLHRSVKLLGLIHSADRLQDLLSTSLPDIKEPQHVKQNIRRSPRLSRK